MNDVNPMGSRQGSDHLPREHERITRSYWSESFDSLRERFAIEQLHREVHLWLTELAAFWAMRSSIENSTHIVLRDAPSEVDLAPELTSKVGVAGQRRLEHFESHAFIDLQVVDLEDVADSAARDELLYPISSGNDRPGRECPSG